MIEHARIRPSRGIHLQQRFHDAFECCRIAANLYLQIRRCNRRRAERRHLQRILRIGEALQRAFLQRIEHDDGRTATCHLMQRAHHARMVGARVVAHRDNEFAMVEVVQRHRTLANANGVRQAHTGGFVTHVGTIGEVIGAELPREQLVKEGGLVRGAARGVELHRIRVVHAAQNLADARKGVVPADGFVDVLVRVVDHGVRQAPLVFQFVVAPVPQRTHRVGGKEGRRHAFVRGFPGNGFRAVLAKLEGRRVLLVRPCTTGAVETLGLIGAQQGDRRVRGVHLFAHGARGGAQRAPSARRLVVDADAGNVLVSHETTSCKA
ncbi:hypothetical protein DyAD56_05860 [Dyella sp. AD56]|nr:hypothetical protein DyAD56_05860 [Dyella sp. AD56]